MYSYAIHLFIGFFTELSRSLRASEKSSANLQTLLDSTIVAANIAPSFLVHGGSVIFFVLLYEFNGFFISADAQAVKDSLISLPLFLDQVGKALGLDLSKREIHRNGQPSASGVKIANPNVQEGVASLKASLSKDDFDVELDDECWDTDENNTPGSSLPFSADVSVPVQWISFR